MSDKMPSEHYALKFLEGGTPKVINGKRYLEMNGELVNVATSISEATFVRDWLLGFSLGYVGEKSYFDFARRNLIIEFFHFYRFCLTGFPKHNAVI